MWVFSAIMKRLYTPKFCGEGFRRPFPSKFGVAAVLQNVVGTPFGAVARWFTPLPARIARPWCFLCRCLFARAGVACSGCASCVHVALWSISGKGPRKHLPAVESTSHPPAMLQSSHLLGASRVWGRMKHNPRALPSLPSWTG